MTRLFGTADAAEGVQSFIERREARFQGSLERVTLGPVAVEGLAMGHYKSNVRDLEFNLFEVLELEKALATGEFGDLDGESVRQMLDEASKLAEGPLAESFADADRHPPTFDPETHVVTIPESFKKSLRAWQQGEWFRVGLDEDIGGVPAPAMVAWAVNELPARRANPRRSCIWRARSWRTSCTTSETKSSGSWHRLRWNAIGPPPWC